MSDPVSKTTPLTATRDARLAIWKDMLRFSDAEILEEIEALHAELLWLNTVLSQRRRAITERSSGKGAPKKISEAQVMAAAEQIKLGQKTAHVAEQLGVTHMGLIKRLRKLPGIAVNGESNVE